MLNRGPLNDDDLETWREKGVLHLRNMLPPSHVQNLSKWTDEIVAAPQEPGRYMVYSEENPPEPGCPIIQRIENFVPYHKGLGDICTTAPVLGIVEQLFGEPAVLFKDKINMKLPGGGGFKPHQDQQAGWSRYAPYFISVLVAIDQATEENGCLEVAFGHHKHGLIGQEWTPLSEVEMAGIAFEPIPCEPGDIVLFDSYLPHGSKPNATDQSRRALYLTYNRASDGDFRTQYFADKRREFPPDIERAPGQHYRFRV